MNAEKIFELWDNYIKGGLLPNDINSILPQTAYL